MNIIYDVLVNDKVLLLIPIRQKDVKKHLQLLSNKKVVY
jgi:hypothetical protein